jgi:hypothetical protein
VRGVVPYGLLVLVVKRAMSTSVEDLRGFLETSQV